MERVSDSHTSMNYTSAVTPPLPLPVHSLICPLAEPCHHFPLNAFAIHNCNGLHRLGEKALWEIKAGLKAMLVSPQR